MKILTLLKKISWFAVLALVISGLGLYFSHQSSFSDIRVSNEVPPKNDLILQGCKSQSRQYTVWLLFQKNFEFSNAGGGKASLNRVQLSDSDKREYVTNLYPTSSNFTTPISTDSTPLVLPVDIETSKTWFITGTYTYPAFNTEQEAMDKINSLLGLKANLTWKFDFSNGQKIERDEMVDSVVPPQIDFNKSNCK